VLVLGLLALCALVLPDVYRQWAEWRQLSQVSLSTQGTVADLERFEDTDTPTTYYATYTFEHTPADGDPRPYEGRERVTAARFSSLQAGAPITVYYVPDDPNISTLRADYAEPPTESLFFAGVWGIGWTVIGGTALLFSLRSMRKGHLLAEKGKVVPGQVLACEQLPHDEDADMRVTYRFRSPVTGVVIQAHTYKRRHETPGQPPFPVPGTTIAVLFGDDKHYVVL
jgi:hypothetical protein